MRETNINSKNERKFEKRTKKENSSTNPLSKKTYALILTFIILIAGSFFYFISLNNSNSAIEKKSLETMNTNDNPQESMETKDINDANQKPILSIFKYELKGIQENNVYIKKNSEGTQKLFYYHSVNEPLNIKLSEGDIEEYQIHSIGGQNYYPLILGYEEAEIMREQEFFSDIGDPVRNFFGKNIVIVGVMQKTEDIFDRIYIIPLNKEELN